MLQTEDGFQRAIGEAHRCYTRYINFRENWRGHLWQERFASYPMGENHLLAAARYVELNPVRVRMVENPVNYPWSSAAAHMNGHDDILVRVNPLLDLIEDWGNFLSGDIEKKIWRDCVCMNEREGRLVMRFSSSIWKRWLVEFCEGKSRGAKRKNGK